jgi:hypothetical protein
MPLARDAASVRERRLIVILDAPTRAIDYEYSHALHSLPTRILVAAAERHSTAFATEVSRISQHRAL